MINMSISARRVAAVVVTFHPNLERLIALLEATVPQAEHVYIVDNGDGLALRELAHDTQRVTLIALGENRGIGAAQNAGIRAAIDAGVEFVLLLDQDSVPQPLMVSQLRDAYERLTHLGHRIAAVGPSAPSHGTPGAFVRFGWFSGFVRRQNAVPQFVKKPFNHWLLLQDHSAFNDCLPRGLQAKVSVRFHFYYF